MDHCSRKVAIEQLKFLWIHQVKFFCGFTKSYFSQMTKWPRNPRKFTPTKIKKYTGTLFHVQYTNGVQWVVFKGNLISLYDLRELNPLKICNIVTTSMLQGKITIEL